MGYSSASAKDICKIFASIVGFLGWFIQYCQKNLPQPTLVAMATKFETKGL